MDQNRGWPGLLCRQWREDAEYMVSDISILHAKDYSTRASRCHYHQLSPLDSRVLDFEDSKGIARKAHLVERVGMENQRVRLERTEGYISSHLEAARSTRQCESRMLDGHEILLWLQVYGFSEDEAVCEPCYQVSSRPVAVFDQVKYWVIVLDRVCTMLATLAAMLSRHTCRTQYAVVDEHSKTQSEARRCAFSSSGITPFGASEGIVASEKSFVVKVDLIVVDVNTLSASGRPDMNTVNIRSKLGQPNMQGPADHIVCPYLIPVSEQL